MNLLAGGLLVRVQPEEPLIRAVRSCAAPPAHRPLVTLIGLIQLGSFRGRMERSSIQQLASFDVESIPRYAASR
jgi:hypothetical protein